MHIHISSKQCWTQAALVSLAATYNQDLQREKGRAVLIFELFFLVKYNFIGSCQLHYFGILRLNENIYCVMEVYGTLGS